MTKLDEEFSTEAEFDLFFSFFIGGYWFSVRNDVPNVLLVV